MNFVFSVNKNINHLFSDIKNAIEHSCWEIRLDLLHKPHLKEGDEELKRYIWIHPVGSQNRRDERVLEIQKINGEFIVKKTKFIQDWSFLNLKQLG